MTAPACSVGAATCDDARGFGASQVTAPSPEVRSAMPSVAAGAGALAVACGVCCVLPIAVPALALSSLGGIVAVVSRGYRWAMWFALAAIAVGWAWVALQHIRSGRRIHPTTRRGMLLATLVVVAAYAWPSFERMVVAALRD